jgi:hypothetical protein
MRNIVRIIGVSLAAMAGSLMVASVAWAQAEETPITVRILDCQQIEEPERDWVDEDGIRHIRDGLYSCKRRRDVVGREIGWSSADIDPTAGHISEHGYYSFTGKILGGELTSGVGRYTTEGNRIDGVWTYTSEDVMHVDGGGLVKLWGTWKGGEPMIYTGVLLETPGGTSRHGPRPRRK